MNDGNRNSKRKANDAKRTMGIEKRNTDFLFIMDVTNVWENKFHPSLATIFHLLGFYYFIGYNYGNYQSMTRCFLILLLFIQSFYSAGQIILKNQHYRDPFLAGVINLKVRADYRAGCRESSIELDAVRRIFNQYGLVKLAKKFPRALPPGRVKNKTGENYADLSLIYRAEFPSVAPLEEIISALKKTGLLQYAEPHFIPRTCFSPNDDSVNAQYALFNIEAFAAWDIWQGDTNTIIGITDTGYDPFHPDLNGNIKYNYADPPNGVDDDKDGFKDNYMGWDMGADDNNPAVDGAPHGIHVTGLCCASTNNKIGMAGTGFRSKYMHIKIADKQGILTSAYEGIVYAADHGCSIINCSWGGNQFSEMNQDVVRYATINKNCLLVCGAGNDNNDEVFYPAGYEYALSIGSTDAQDIKADFSNFGYDIDLNAPGYYVLSTWVDGSYLRSGGTSMSAPVVAGAAALLRSAFPDWNSRQIAEQLRLTADVIDTLPANKTWKGLLGSGRLNMLRALTETGKPAIVLNNISLNGKRNNLFLPGDTILMEGLLVNYLSAATTVKLELSSLSNAVKIINPLREMGSMAKLKTIPLTGQPFLIRVDASADINEKVILRLRSDADGIIRDQYITFNVYGDFINVETSAIKTSIGSQGSVGVSGNNFMKGLGFEYKGIRDLLYEGGLMVGRMQDKVIDNVRGEDADSLQLFTSESLKQVEPLTGTTEQYRGKLVSGIESFPLHGEQRVLVSKLPEHKNFVIVEYLLTNTSSEDYTGFRTGLFCDWDLADAGKNRAEWNNGLKLGYVFTLPQDTLYTGVQLLSEGAANFYAIDNIPGGAGGIDATDGFSKAEKYKALSEPKLIAGATATDVLTVTSGGPFSIRPGESVRTAFALLGASSKNELFQSALNALLFYYQTGLPLSTTDMEEGGWDVYPNPVSDMLYLSCTSPLAYPVSFEMHDLTGRMVSIHPVLIYPWGVQIDVSGVAGGTYFLRIIQGNRSFIRRIVVSDRQ